MMALRLVRYRPTLAIFLVVVLGVGAWQFLDISAPIRHAFAEGATCNASVPSPLTLERTKGIRTKWRSLARDERNTIQPDLAGLQLKEWMVDLEAADVNLAEINLEPANKLATRPMLSDADLNRAVDAIYLPPSERTDSARSLIANLERDIIPGGEYTVMQRNEVQVDFLRRLEALRRQGNITGSVRFIIHQRLWFRPQGEEKRQIHAEEFVDDMTSFIRLAERNCLGHWIAGVRLGEHSNNDMSQLLPLIVDLAGRINARTGGWLKTHMFVANGGGWGAEYKGIDRVVGQEDRPYPFFARIAAETGSFAFAYKWMQFHDKIGTGIVEHMLATNCAPAHRCDPNSVADWDVYLGDILGFNALISYVVANQGRYPGSANVVFAGDSSDSVANMVETGNGDRIVDSPPLIALRQLFARLGAAGRGRIFENGYSAAETMRSRRDDNRVDIGRALYFVDTSGRARLLSESKRIWDNWPKL
jgi:hypothetical protein